jgi:beta-lactamase superfamily II metal-dependent hydrolase
MAAKKTTKPSKVTIRSYDVGFGDCFLLTFHYGKQRKNVLIDFGSTAAAKKGVPLDMAIAENIADVTKGLDAIVVTHRHADHISGFTPRKGKGSGDIIRKLAKNAVIVQPWTEDPKVKPKATAPQKGAGTSGKSLAMAQVRSMEAMHQVAAIVARRAGAIDVSGLTDEGDAEDSGVETTASRSATLGISKGKVDKLRFLGETNLKNLEAIKNLMTMSSAAKRHYVSFGSKSGLERVLPGVEIDVLGPPTVAQSKDVLKERRNDQAEFWMLAARATNLTTSANKALFPDERFVAGTKAPRMARWFISKVRQIHSEQLFELVRIVDDALNNTSVILLFTIGKTRLLFPGDAQIENWQYALKLSDKKDQILKKLAAVNVYKVGHHGSRNATPKTLWKKFKNKGKGLLTLMSTKAGKFPGRPGSGTEVPRKTLLEELQAHSRLTNTQDLSGSKKDFFVDVNVPLR